MRGRSSRAARAGRPAGSKAGLRAPAPRAAFPVLGALRARQLDWGEICRMDRPLSDNSTTPAHAAPGRNAAFDTHTARPSEAGRGDRQGWRPQHPSGGVTNRGFASFGTHAPNASRNRLSRVLAPTRPLGWGRESGFRVAWRPQNPSGGVTNRVFASLGTHKTPRMASRIVVSRRLAPTNPPGWRRELRLAPFGAHGPARGSGPATPGKDAMV